MNPHITQSSLILDAIASPNDEYQRSKLYNIDNKLIELKGFKLQMEIMIIQIHIELDLIFYIMERMNFVY